MTYTGTYVPTGTTTGNPTWSSTSGALYGITGVEGDTISCGLPLNVRVRVNPGEMAPEEILTQLELNTKPRLRVFNKADKVDSELAEDLARRFDGVVISALDRRSLKPLIERLQRFFRD